MWRKKFFQIVPWCYQYWMLPSWFHLRPIFVFQNTVYLFRLIIWFNCLCLLSLNYEVLKSIMFLLDTVQTGFRHTSQVCHLQMKPNPSCQHHFINVTFSYSHKHRTPTQCVLDSNPVTSSEACDPRLTLRNKHFPLSTRHQGYIPFCYQRTISYISSVIRVMLTISSYFCCIGSTYKVYQVLCLECYNV